MSLQVCSIASGSNGNCYYVGNETEAVLVDAGITCKEIELRMKRAGLSMQKVRAILVSHEHSDHIVGLPVVAKKYNLPVYITDATLKNARFRLERALIKPYVRDEEMRIGALEIKPFSKWHDAADPYSFNITCSNTTVGVMTDIGRVCDNVIKHFSACHAVFLEANYDDDMLQNGNYPYFLKNRIRNGHGHLSNAEALTLFQKHRPAFLSHVFLSHLSRNNNCPKLVEELFTTNAEGVQMIVTSRFKESAVYDIYANDIIQWPQHNKLRNKAQLAFSF